jgi:predicted alpha/beta superfamily hydrolase
VLHSTVLSGRRLTIYTPADLEPGANLLMLHDGQNLFDPERSYVHGQTWQVAETADQLIADGLMPPTVIVGIDHGGDRRLREFGHGASSYGRFVVREVLPYLRATYAVRRDVAGTALGGSSMGGLVTLQIAAMFPDVFGRILVFSPSVWWNRRAVLRTIRRPGPIGGLFSRSRGLRDDTDVWLSIGLQEGDSAVADARRLRDVILTMRRGNQSRLRYVEYSDGTHSERSWAQQLRRALIS